MINKLKLSQYKYIMSNIKSLVMNYNKFIELSKINLLKSTSMDENKIKKQLIKYMDTHQLYEKTDNNLIKKVQGTIN